MQVAYASQKSAHAFLRKSDTPAAEKIRHLGQNKHPPSCSKPEDQTAFAMSKPVSSIPQQAVAEVQGLYGPFTFSEKLLQQIWDRRDFDTQNATTADGQRIRINGAGKWNHLGGPDFKNARLQIGGVDVVGDIEVHLRETDWHLHQHATDSAYANVVLHVVLFPPRSTHTSGADKRKIPILTLLPLLHHDLEQYAADAAIERLAEHPLTHAHKKLTSLPQSELDRAIARHGERRWVQKIHFAKIRIERLGWEAACHHTALEVLGYSANRPAMLTTAEMFPLNRWRASSLQNALEAADNIHAQQAAANLWARQATRPANHPRTRLHQYAAWMLACPTWPEKLQGLAAQFKASAAMPGSANVTSTVAQWRRARKATDLRKRIKNEICGDAVGGTRLDTLITDGFFPLLAAKEPAQEPAIGIAWKNWFIGDLPAQFSKHLRMLKITGTREAPAHNGAAQGLIGFLLEIE